MREILFRGKRKDNGEWVYGDLLHSKTRTGKIVTEICTLAMKYQVFLGTVGECTGLPDKNDKYICEDDIVEADGRRERVRFEDGCFYPMGAFIARSGFAYDKNDYEVVGNVHDNPELLEVRNG